MFSFGAVSSPVYCTVPSSVPLSPSTPPTTRPRSLRLLPPSTRPRAAIHPLISLGQSAEDSGGRRVGPSPLLLRPRPTCSSPPQQETQTTTRWAALQRTATRGSCPLASTLRVHPRPLTVTAIRSASQTSGLTLAAILARWALRLPNPRLWDLGPRLSRCRGHRI